MRLLLQFAAKKLDRRLLHLGAEPVLEIGLGDDQHPSGYVFNISLALCKYCDIVVVKFVHYYFPFLRSISQV